MKAITIICADSLSEACDYADQDEVDFGIKVTITSELYVPPPGVNGPAYVDVEVEGDHDAVIAALRDAWSMSDEEIAEAMA